MKICSYICMYNLLEPIMTTLTQRIDQQKMERAAYVLKAVAHPVRISIIDLLDQSERLTVTELQQHLSIEQSLLSHHLTNLRDKGLLTTQRDGKNVYYSLADRTIIGIIECINRCTAF